jgi:hypothetical protein
MVKNQLWYILTIKKQIIVIKSFIHINWIFVNQNPKKMNFWIGNILPKNIMGGENLTLLFGEFGRALEI